jgi:hypothetical protein
LRAAGGAADEDDNSGLFAARAFRLLRLVWHAHHRSATGVAA